MARILFWVLGTWALCLCGTAAAQTARPGEGQRAQDFIAAFNKGDAKAVASFWTPEGDYVDQSGRQYKGRTALERLYQSVFAERKGAKLKIHVISVRKLGEDTALEDGISEVIPADGGPPSTARFSAVLVKKDGVWYFESVHDTVARPHSNAQHLQELEWLLGAWKGEEEKGESARATFAWAENQNFIVSSFATTLNGVPVVGGTQWIGWDAVDKKIRSWSFYSGGGFGEATWTRDGNKWTLTTTARSADGRKVTATNLVTQVDADTATWQVKSLTVDGKTMPDAPLLKLKRVRSTPPTKTTSTSR